MKCLIDVVEMDILLVSTKGKVYRAKIDNELRYRTPIVGKCDTYSVHLVQRGGVPGSGRLLGTVPLTSADSLEGKLDLCIADIPPTRIDFTRL